MLSTVELKSLLSVVEISFEIRRHEDLFNWLSTDVQRLLPHEILIAAWGDFSLGIIHLDLISQLPGLRTTEIEKRKLLPLLRGLFSRWCELVRAPFIISWDVDEPLQNLLDAERDFYRPLTEKRTAVVQVIRDERGRQDCLYVAISAKNLQFDMRSVLHMRLLTPYFDVALRQVSLLPSQHRGYAEDDASSLNEESHEPLSGREKEIMHWVEMGKTNSEIGLILDISAFTVKNHIKRIFRKLNVQNRAQAVSFISKLR